MKLVNIGLHKTKCKRVNYKNNWNWNQYYEKIFTDKEMYIPIDDKQ